MASTMRVLVMTLMGFTTTQGAKVLRASQAGFVSAFSTRSSSFSHPASSFRQRAAPVVMAECEKMYTVVLLRHGESTWNEENKFTGWYDCPLSVKGVEEAKKAGELLKSANFEFDVAHTSVLKRAIKTLWLALEELDQMYIPQKKSWRLNERHYGALQGLNKKETVAKHGKDQVNVWRRSYDVPPPPLDTSSEFYPGNDPRYKDVDKSLLPLTESLKITEERFMPCWVDQIAPDIKCGKRVIIAAHGNTLRALVKHLDNISEQEICELNIPTGIPLVYDLDENLKPIPHKDAIAPLTGYYLGNPEEVLARIQGVAAQTGGK